MNIRRRHLLLILRFLLGLCLLAYILATKRGTAAAKLLFSQIWILPAMVAFSLFTAMIGSIRLGLLLDSQGVHLSFGKRYRLVSIGSFFNFCLPGGTGGDVVKLYYLTSENRGRGIELAMVLLIDRFVALFSLMVLTIGLALLENHLIMEHALIRWLVIGSAVGVGGGMLVVAAMCFNSIRGSRLFRSILRRIPFRHSLERAFDALYAFRNHKRAVMLAAFVCLLGHLGLAGMFGYTGRILIPQATGLTTPVLALFGMLANALPVTPGGLGVGEAAFDRLFNIAGFAGGATLLLTWRAGLLPLCAIGCLFYVLGVRRPATNRGPRWNTFSVSAERKEIK